MPERLDARTRHARNVSLLELDRLVVTRELRPDYVTSADAPWLQALLDERTRFVGRRRRTWNTHLSESLGISAPPHKLRVAARVLDTAARDRTTHAVAPRTLRAQVFRAASRHATREAALAEAKQQLGMDDAALMRALFADLPDERALAPLPAALDAVQLALLCNELIISQLLQRALRVRIHARGRMRAVVRHAKCVGLLCLVRTRSEGGAVLEVSGPLSLFRHTRLYGRALASLVPRLARCDSYRLEAECVDKSSCEVARLVLRSSDPIIPAHDLPKYDSQLEARFAADFGKLALEWEVVREPAPIALEGGLLFPDFELCRRTTGERYWLEVIGFWTPEYLAHKLDQLRRARLSGLILCVDAARQCDAGELDALGSIVRFRRKIDARDVIAIVDPGLAARLAEQDRRSRGRKR